MWQGLKCNLEGICFHAFFCKAVSIMLHGSVWVFSYPQPAALHSPHRKADLPLVLGVLNYLVELAQGRWNDWAMWGWEESHSNSAYSHATVCLMCICVQSRPCFNPSLYISYLQVFLVGLTCRWGNKLFGVFSSFLSWKYRCGLVFNKKWTLFCPLTGHTFYMMLYIIP